ncbi:hypothetical protein QE392_001622 [Microbacterium proteolyticum]|nr:hypothetical protein [Microbacterium sp. SORGH_AS_0344]MDQ1169818.1 hypothetical protein [Microbacterium proteolyticum]
MAFRRREVTALLSLTATPLPSMTRQDAPDPGPPPLA